MTPPVAAPSKPRGFEPDVGYANARLRGMRSHLLDDATYDRLIDAPSVIEVIRALQSTPYSDDLDEEIVHGRTAAVVDDALKDNMVRNYRKVLTFLNPSSSELLRTLLGRWDLFNIKTVLRGIHHKISPEEIRSGLLPAGVLDPVELDELARLTDVRAVINTLAMWGVMYAGPLRTAYPEYHAQGSLPDLELAADMAYADWAADRLKGRGDSVAVARRILGIQVDVLNLVTAFRLLKSDMSQKEAEKYFLEGGRSIRKELFLELSGLSDVDEVLDRVKKTPYGEALEVVAGRYLERGSISVFERALEEYLMKSAKLAGVRDPLGVGLSISYLWGKQNEVTNLRIIVKGKDVGMPAERVREELIRV